MARTDFSTSRSTTSRVMTAPPSWRGDVATPIAIVMFCRRPGVTPGWDRVCHVPRGGRVRWLGSGAWPMRTHSSVAVSYTHLRAHETDSYLVCRLLLEKKKK